MQEWFWNLVAKIVTQPKVTQYLIKRAEKTPQSHLGNYMLRFWLFKRSKNFPFAIKIHHILREDLDKYPHDHPCDFRSFVLKGYSVEEDINGNHIMHEKGDTYGRRAEEWHRIVEVQPSGTITLFIWFKYRQKWGFLVPNEDGVPRKVPHEKYESENDRIG